MAQRGQVSKAHEYNANGACKHCHMYRVNVEALSHVCTVARENLIDAAEAGKRKISLADYRAGGVSSQTT